MLRADAASEESDDNNSTSRLLVSDDGPTNDISHGSSSISSSEQEPADVYRSRWRSIRVMYLVMFLGSVTFTITMSSLWPFLQVLNPAASTSFLGWVVAAYSLGQLVASPFFGGWANLRKSSREPLVVSLTLTTLSNVFYMYLQSFPFHKDIFMILARGLIGFSAGNVAVVRSYVSGATTIGERTGSMANLSIFQAMGFILGPVIQAALVPVGYPGPVELEYFHFNMYTAPGFCAAVVAAISVLLLIFVFKEHRVFDDDIKAILRSTSNSVEDQGTVINARLSDSLLQMQFKIDYLAVCSSIFLFFIVLFMFTVFETIGTPLTMHMYAWDKTKATLYQGIILGAAGCLSIVVFMLVKILAKRYSERFLLLGGFIFCLCGYFTFIPWGDKLPPLGFSTINGTVSSSDAIFTLSDYLFKGGQEGALSHISKRETAFDQYSLDLVHNFAIPDLAYNSGGPIHGDSLHTSDKLEKDLVRLSAQPRHGFANLGESSKMASSSVYMVRNITVESTTSSDIASARARSLITKDTRFTTTNKSLTVANIPNLTTNGRFAMTSNSSLITNPSLTTNLSLTTNNASLTTNENLTTTNSPNINTTTTIAPNGCPAEFEWCKHVPAIYLGQFLGGTVLISIGYPVCQMLSYALYSKMLGPKPQGLWMGWLTAAGSLARTIGPVYVSQIYDSFGPQVTFGSCCGIIALTIIYYLMVFRRMVPYSPGEGTSIQVEASAERGVR